MRRRGVGDIWQGLWEPLNVEEENFLHFSSSVSHLQVIKNNVKHVLTHRILLADFYLLETEERLQLPADYQWLLESELDNYAVPRLVELLFEALP